MATPGRIAGAGPDQAGRALLSHPLPGVRLDANSRLELLLLEHAQSVLAGSAAQVGQLITWSPSWSGPAGRLLDRGQGQSQLIGCATFWIRGGAEQAEH
jgi:hypothetical protein